MISAPVARWTARERGLHPSALVTVGVLCLLAMVQDRSEPLTAAFSNFSWAWLVLFTLLLGAGIIATEIESGHAQVVLLRPLTRAQFVLGRFAGAALVLCAGATFAWLVSQGAAISRGQFSELPGRLAALPLALLPALGWLATLTALSTVLPGWTNAGALIGARVGWFLLAKSLPLATRNEQVQAVVSAIESHFGPQDLLGMARRFQNGEAVTWSLIAWDLFWLFGALLAAVALFNRRELARRRA